MESLIKRIDLKIIIVLFILSSNCTEKSELSNEEIKIKKDLVLFSDKIQTMDIELIEPLFYDQTSLEYFLDDKKNINQQFINNLIWIIKNEEYEINLFDDSSFVLNAGTNTKNIGDFTKGYYFFIETKDTLKFWKMGPWK
jgi:hypothetical protein